MKNKTKDQRTKFHFMRGRAQNKTCALVTKEMKITEIVEKYPQTLSLFLDYGMHCIGCPIAPDETLEEAAKATTLI